MTEQTNNEQSDILIEKIKERPINKRILLRRTILTALMAVLFGLISCLTFIFLQPLLNKTVKPEKEPSPIYFPEDLEEMSPEDMLTDTIKQQIGNDTRDGSEDALPEDEIIELIQGVSMNLDNCKQLYQSMSDYVTKLKQCMVKITGIKSSTDWLNNTTEEEITVSGVLIYKTSNSLIVLTNYKKLKNVENLRVTFYNNYRIEASLIKSDAATGLAVLSVPTSGFSQEFLDNENLVAKLGSSNLRGMEMTPVVVLGQPMGIANSVGYGIITATGGSIYKPDMNYKILQTNIYGSKNADGILFNLQGEVLGVITDGKEAYDIDGLLSAYGISSLKNRIGMMSREEAIPYAGIIGTGVTMDVHESQGMPYGAYVKEIVLNSPAMLAGLQQGDIIYAIDEKNIISYSDYSTELMTKKPGQTISVIIYRRAQDTYKDMVLEITLE